MRELGVYSEGRYNTLFPHRRTRDWRSSSFKPSFLEFTSCIAKSLTLRLCWTLFSGLTLLSRPVGEVCLRKVRENQPLFCRVERWSVYNERLELHLHTFPRKRPCSQKPILALRSSEGVYHAVPIFSDLASPTSCGGKTHHFSKSVVLVDKLLALFNLVRIRWELLVSAGAYPCCAAVSPRTGLNRRRVTGRRGRISVALHGGGRNLGMPHSFVIANWRGGRK